VIIEDWVKEKILDNHNVGYSEVKETFLNNPYFFKAKGGRYMAIGLCNRYITVIFDYEEDNSVFVITVYPSSDDQRKLYKRKKQ
tara:strand:- start:328 stop:579 length:252 start_codon:yes stop_codon:yes gene_type:complete